MYNDFINQISYVDNLWALFCVNPRSRILCCITNHLFQTHSNPCFLRKDGGMVGMVKDQKKLMENGDMFGLLRDRLFFKVMYDVPNGSIKRYLNKQLLDYSVEYIQILTYCIFCGAGYVYYICNIRYAMFFILAGKYYLKIVS